MAAQLFNTPNYLYWLIVALVIAIETMTLGRLWKKKEAYRWTTGYATVFALSLPLVAAGYWDIGTWAGLGLGQFRDSLEAQQARRQRPHLVLRTNDDRSDDDAAHPWQ